MTRRPHSRRRARPLGKAALPVVGWGREMWRTRVGVGVATVLVVGLAAGCGGSDQSATEKWADGVCSAVSEWRSSLTDVQQNLSESGMTRKDITNAWDDAKSATQKLADDLQGLGKPDTQAGGQAQAAVNDLQDNLTSNVDTIQTAVDGATTVSGVLSAVSVASGTLVTMGNQVQSTVNELRQIDGAQGELQNAFEQSDSCKELRSS